GIDGSEVLAHFPPADTYNATAEVEELRRSARDYKDHDRSRHSLLVFGYGDGGGGPTPEMLETLRRVGDLQGVPRTRLMPPDQLFDLLEQHDAELLAAVAARVAGSTYPSEELAALWRLLLLNQFHDILPGSSIGEVYVE